MNRLRADIDVSERNCKGKSVIETCPLDGLLSPRQVVDEPVAIYLDVRFLRGPTVSSMYPLFEESMPYIGGVHRPRLPDS